MARGVREIPWNVARLCRTKSSPSPWGGEAEVEKSEMEKARHLSRNSRRIMHTSKYVPLVIRPRSMLSRCSTSLLLPFRDRVRNLFDPPPSASCSRFDDPVPRYDSELALAPAISRSKNKMAREFTYT